MTKIRAIFLDLDDAILDFSRAEASALRRVLTEEGIPAGGAVLARYHDINAVQWALWEERKNGTAAVLHRRLAAAGIGKNFHLPGNGTSNLCPF